MSTDINVVIEAPTAELLPSKAEVAQFLERSGQGDPDDLVDQTTDVPARWVLQWWGDKYGATATKLVDECISLSEAFPAVTVHLDEEWDDEGPGGEGYEWKAGEIIRSGSLEWVWKDEK